MDQTGPLKDFLPTFFFFLTIVLPEFFVHLELDFILFWLLKILCFLSVWEENGERIILILLFWSFFLAKIFSNCLA